MTYGQLGIIDGVAFGFALLLDIPTGAIADLIGRKKTIQFSMIASFIGSMMIATASSMPVIFVGWMITQLGFAFFSGSAEALIYDTLVEAKKEGDYDKLISKSNSISLIADATCTFLGGFIFVLSFRMPHILWSLSYLFGFIISCLLVESKIESTKFSFADYFSKLGDGIKELFKPALRGLLIFFFILLGVYYMYSWGFIRPAMADSFGFHAKEQGIILPMFTILSAYIMRFMPALRKKISDIAGLIVLSITMAISFMMAFFPLGYWGFFVLLFIAMSGKLAYPWISVVINREIPSSSRATTLSAISFISKLPYVLVAIVAGSAVQSGKLHTFNLAVGLTILSGVILSMILVKVSKKHTVVVTGQ